LLIACFTDDDIRIESDDAQRIFSLDGHVHQSAVINNETKGKAQEIILREKQKVLHENAERNREFFDVEMDKLDQWAEDMKISLEKEIKDLDAEIKLRKSEAKKMMKLEDKVAAQRVIKDMERKRNEKRQTLYVTQDEIDANKDKLLTDIEKMLNQKIEQKELFTVKWRII